VLRVGNIYFLHIIIKLHVMLAESIFLNDNNLLNCLSFSVISRFKKHKITIVMYSYLFT